MFQFSHWVGHWLSHQVGTNVADAPSGAHSRCLGKGLNCTSKPEKSSPSDDQGGAVEA